MNDETLCAGSGRDCVKRTMDLKQGTCPECTALVPVTSLGKTKDHPVPPSGLLVNGPMSEEEKTALRERFKQEAGSATTQILSETNQPQVTFIAGNRPPQKGTVVGVIETFYSWNILDLKNLEVARMIALDHLLEVFDDLVYDSGNAELQNRATAVKDIYTTLNEMCDDNGL